MILSIAQNHLLPHLEKELHFGSFLTLFNRSIPILPSKLLTPLDKQHATKHFAIIQELLDKNSKKSIDLSQLISQAALSPLLDHLLPFFLKKELAPYHFYELTQFVANELCILQHEGELDHYCLSDRDSDQELLNSILNILESATEAGGAHLCLSEEALGLKKTIDEIEAKIESAISCLETDIFKTTGRRFSYPYPAEIFDTDSDLIKLANSPFLTCTAKGSVITVGYRLPESLTTLHTQRDEAKNNFKKEVDKFLLEINSSLVVHYSNFARYYQWRKEQVYRYSLALTCIEQQLCLPNLCDAGELQLEDGYLPRLKNQRQQHYVPLTINLRHGPNLLYGANMAGKTTVIKTLYFLLTLVRFGLPIPAKMLRCQFPEQVEILLKSSGNIENAVSSFGEELEFFSKEFTNNSYIFVDELFQTTNPQSGVQLSKLVLETMTELPLTFFATTHYPELIHDPKVELYRMKEMQFSRNVDRTLSSRDLLGKIPFTIEYVGQNRNRAIAKDQTTPLMIASHFPLFAPLRQKVRDTFLLASELKDN